MDILIGSQVLLLLQMLQSVECPLIEYLLQLSAREGTFAVCACEADRATLALANFGLNVLLRAVHTEEV
jgi:hypothetical protein